MLNASSLNLDKNPVSFRRHRKTFVARRPKSVYQKSLALQRELGLQAAREERLATAYLNRLSDLLFVMARKADLCDNRQET